MFDIKPETDVYWCSADIGWVTGHSYIVYGPLANGCTSILYEGAPDYPDKDRWWDIVERYRCTVFYTAPTAIRACIKWGREYPDRHDLVIAAAAGQRRRADQPARLALVPRGDRRRAVPDRRHVVADRDRPHHDHAAAGHHAPEARLGDGPVPGRRRPRSTTPRATRSQEGGGILVLKRPWPGMFRTLYKEPERYVETYWSKYGPEIYVVGDAARRDADGYFWVVGRTDDVINVSGHRLSTMEVESALVSHPKVAEAAVVPEPDETTGQAIVAFVTMEGGGDPPDGFDTELREHVSVKIGKLARPKRLIWADDLPKTRSGKIMRRLLRDIASGPGAGRRDDAARSDGDAGAAGKGRSAARRGMTYAGCDSRRGLRLRLQVACKRIMV